MKIRTLLCIVLAFGFSTAAIGQSVSITPKTTVYRRPKPIHDFKRTFTVRRPIARASTPALSRAITAAISPETVLQINIREEIDESQWLEAADYEVLFNKYGILTIKLWMEGTGAYPWGETRVVVVDLRTGRRVSAAQAFTDLHGLAAMIKKAQSAEVASAIEEIKKDAENRDVDPAEIFRETDFTADSLKQFSVTDDGVTFYYDYGFPHVLKAVQPEGEYKFSWTELKPFVRGDGLLARFVR